MNTAKAAIDVDGRAMPGVLALPEPEDPRPAVLVLPEIFGVTAEIRRIAELLAGAGYVALVPNCFYRTHPDLNSQYTPEGTETGIAAAAATMAHLLRDLDAAIGWLKAQPFVRQGQIGAWGFCIGASVAFVAATLPEIACSICFYGAQIARPCRSGEPPALGRANEVKAPLLLAFGGRDQSIPPDAIAAIGSTLNRLGKRHEIAVYPDADHGFFRHGGSNRDRAEVADAWSRVQAMLAAELD